MASSPSMEERDWGTRLDVHLSSFYARLDEVRDRQERDERCATPEVGFSNGLHSFKMECEQLQTEHTPGEIKTAYRNIQKPEFFCTLIIHQLLAISKIFLPAREKTHTDALRRGSDCLSAFLHSIGANPEETRNEIKDQSFWKLQVEALKALRQRKFADAEYGNSAVTEPTPRRPGRNRAHAPAKRHSRRKSPLSATEHNNVLKPRRTAKQGRVEKPPTQQRTHHYKLRNRNKDSAA